MGSNEDKRKACEHLRRCLVHLLRAWDEAGNAERAYGIEIDSSSESVECALSSFDGVEDIESLTDDKVLELFGVSQVD